MPLCQPRFGSAWWKLGDRHRTLLADGEHSTVVVIGRAESFARHAACFSRHAVRVLQNNREV